MTLSPLAVHEAATALLQCCCDALGRIPDEVPGLAGCPCRSCVTPGTPAADACGDGCGPLPDGTYPGQLSVNVVRLYGSDYQQFPREVQAVRDTRDCLPPQATAVELNVTVFRCAPMPTADGCPPSCEELSASAMQLHVDMLSVQQAVLCCYAATSTTGRRGRRYVLGPSTTLAPQGGCVGFVQRVTVALDDSFCCDDLTSGGLVEAAP